jgi:hypothetical protein
MIRTAPKARPGTYSAPIWITGAAGFTDSDPNSVAPAAGRILTIPITTHRNRWDPWFILLSGGATAVGTGHAAVTFLADGTSASIRYWWKDDTLGTWFPVGLIGNLNYATNNGFNFSGIILPGAKIFAQITANSGVTKFAMVAR